MATSSFATDYSTPENAIKSLEAAYINKDLKAAIDAKDFNEEARLMLHNINPKFSSDPVVLKQTAEVLELAFKKEMKTKGFPKFSNLKCSYSVPEELSSNLVKVTETCVFPNNETSLDYVHVFKSEKGWRVVVLP